VITQALEVMAATGALQPRVPQPSAALVAARDRVSRLVISWSDALADSVAAMNLFLDEDKPRRRRALESVRARTGACRNDGPFAVENALRGRWRMRCERGAIDVAITLAPTIPPGVQYLDVVLADTTRALAPAPTCPSVDR
jgi:hypothetical protein